MNISGAETIALKDQRQIIAGPDLGFDLGPVLFGLYRLRGRRVDLEDLTG